MSIHFGGKVAIVTGAGIGLGREYALELARRGARVMVNDLGGLLDGQGSSSIVANKVVQEIIDAGGEALANSSNVTDENEVNAMVDHVMKKWGRIDILINNAGILRDKSFKNMTLDDFRAVMEVHYFGSVNCTKAVWEIMREQQYGRIVMTTSSSGLYGNFGQSNYGAAKMALVGLMNTLGTEGEKYNIRVNSISPCAATRMLKDLISPEVVDLLKPEYVAPAVIYLVSEQAPNRAIVDAGAGVFARTYICETEGVHFANCDITPENLADRWEQLCDDETQIALKTGADQTIKFIKQAAQANGITLPVDYP